MRYIVEKERMIPLSCAVDDEELINEYKKEMVAEIIDELEFNVEEIPYGDEYIIRMKLDIDVKDWDKTGKIEIDMDSRFAKMMMKDFPIEDEEFRRQFRFYHDEAAENYVVERVIHKKICDEWLEEHTIVK